MAVDAAYSAFKEWSKKTAEERSQLLLKWHCLIEEHTDELAEIITTELGKPLSEAKGEIFMRIATSLGLLKKENEFMAKRFRHLLPINVL